MSDRSAPWLLSAGGPAEPSVGLRLRGRSCPVYSVGKQQLSEGRSQGSSGALRLHGKQTVGTPLGMLPPGPAGRGCGFPALEQGSWSFRPSRGIVCSPGIVLSSSEGRCCMQAQLLNWHLSRALCLPFLMGASPAPWESACATFRPVRKEALWACCGDRWGKPPATSQDRELAGNLFL